VEVRCGREIVILDAGTGIRELGKDLAREFDHRAARIWILISHTHWDHIQGFPFFAPAYRPRHQIRIVGWRGSHAGLRRTLAAAVESPFFPIPLREMAGNITVEELSDLSFRVGALRARAALLNHPGGGVGYRLDSRHGSVAYMPDHEVPCPPRDGAPTGPRELSPGVTARFRARDAAVRDMLRGVDVLIHDAQYTVEEYHERVGWGHSCVDAVVAMATECRVGRLILFHHDPDRNDEQVDLMLKKAREQAAALGSELVIDAAREGMELHLVEGGTRT
jgi:phosphoribosyl 1,2-cyclic phosphodiesterase